MKKVYYNRTNETKEKLRKANLGKKISEESKRKNREKHLGRKHTVETRNKLRIAALKQWERQHSQIGG